MAKLVDAPDLGSGSERSGGSSPLPRTLVSRTYLGFNILLRDVCRSVNHRELFENAILLRSLDRFGLRVVARRRDERLVSESRRDHVARGSGAHRQRRMRTAKPMRWDARNVRRLADPVNGSEHPMPSGLGPE